MKFYQTIYLLTVLYFAPKDAGWYHEKKNIGRVITMLVGGGSDYGQSYQLYASVVAEISEITRSLFDCRSGNVTDEITEKIGKIYEIVSEIADEEGWNTQ